MKVCVGLFGIHYLDKLNHWMGWKTSVNYKNTLNNNIEKIYSRCDCTFYSSTYFSPIINNLINDFNFKHLELREVDNSSSTDVVQSFINRNKVFLDTVELIMKDKSNNCDYVLLTRYDLLFKQSPFDLNLKYDKINFVCKSKWGDNDSLCDDNFYFMPMSMLAYFYKNILSLPIAMSSHEYHKYIRNKNYLIDGKYFSHEIPVYSIYRS
jgi:hypothetical protein